MAGNQTGLLVGVIDKESYEKFRIDVIYQRLSWLKKHFPCQRELQAAIDEGLCWAEARKRNWNRRGGIRIIWKYRKFSRLTSVFEIISSRIAGMAIQKVIEIGKRNLV